MRAIPLPSFGSLLLALLAGLGAVSPALPAQGEVLRVIAMPPAEADPGAGTDQGRIVDDSLWQDWTEHRDRAIAQGATIIVLEITTPGGLLGTARQMVKDLRALRREQGIRTVAYVPENAISAGAMIAFGCKEVIMAPRASIGNVIPIRFRDLSSFEPVPEKAATELAREMSLLAREGGFPEILLKAMVLPELSVIQVFRNNQPTQLVNRDDFERDFPGELPPGVRITTIDGPGEALTLFGEDAPLFGLPIEQALSRDDLPRALGLGDRPLAAEELMELPAPRRFGPFDFLLGELDFSIIFLILGIVFFILELKTPGLGIAGVLGILSFVGYFAFQTGDGAQTALTFGLLVGGLLLIMVEVLILPGFGVAGISGLLLVFFAIYSASVGLEGEGFWDRVIPDSDRDWNQVQGWTLSFLGSLVLGVAGALFVARHLHRVPFLKQAFLGPPGRDEMGHRVAQAKSMSPTGPGGHVDVALGTRGCAETDLRPAGRALLDGSSVDVVSRGEWIARGAPIEVVLIEGNRVVVGPASGTAS